MRRGLLSPTRSGDRSQGVFAVPTTDTIIRSKSGHLPQRASGRNKQPFSFLESRNNRPTALILYGTDGPSTKTAAEDVGLCAPDDEQRELRAPLLTRAWDHPRPPASCSPSQRRGNFAGASTTMHRTRVPWRPLLEPASGEEGPLAESPSTLGELRAQHAPRTTVSLGPLSCSR